MAALDLADCWARLAQADHGVLATVHATRGVDAVPVVFAIVEDQIVVPVDTVKPKGDHRLQRLTNLAADDRCVLLCEHYETDWSRLWWVRVHGRAVEQDPSDPMRAALAARHSEYGSVRAIVAAIVITVDAVKGWSASNQSPGGSRC